jgi:hypothetical protein
MRRRKKERTVGEICDCDCNDDKSDGGDDNDYDYNDCRFVSVNYSHVLIFPFPVLIEMYLFVICKLF